jgi:hypothetical protein
VPNIFPVSTPLRIAFVIVLTSTSWVGFGVGGTFLRRRLRDIGATTQIRINDVSRYTYRVMGEQRHAVSAVLVARALARPPVK